MNRINKPGALRMDRRVAREAFCDEPSGAFAWKRIQAAPRALFATPPVDLTTLVIADAIKRKQQAELQREALRDALYEIPASPGRGHERGADIRPLDPDDYD
ncbi:hypothetical protein P3T18_003230 [Paraburkholderia sp. GAS199]|uniref:hypothetical protein n=1 Tax=Paraburkholderia sp. GAS199 TaxID=3035126 RepID=UPI003D1BD25D